MRWLKREQQIEDVKQIGATLRLSAWCVQFSSYAVGVCTAGFVEAVKVLLLVPDPLTLVLVALYEEPEKPNSALDFLKHHLGASAPENPEVEALRLEVAEMKEKYEAVLEENKKLKTKLAQYEPPEDEKHGE
ncbi:PREDICTED: C-Myc-binding protein [Chlamydotis macqueenii]|uniref:C-Myc-binding protein n=1 Tax=Chlamydotis macqueenii TaxID=187382 RepID=UPI000529E5EA|nr:PREDICTED: C-Myc-binding protein [Chlamydotis macqueenii]